MSNNKPKLTPEEIKNLIDNPPPPPIQAPGAAVDFMEQQEAKRLASVMPTSPGADEADKKAIQGEAAYRAALIKVKVAAGLTKEQAAHVANAQIAHEKALASQPVRPSTQD